MKRSFGSGYLMTKIRIIDASVSVRALIPHESSPDGFALIRYLSDEEAVIFAPTLHVYEVDSALRQAVQNRVLTGDQAETARRQFDSLGIEFLPPNTELSLSAIAWAARLPQSKAYDAHYLALAEHLGAEFWTFDKRLAAAARATGADWARLASEAIA